MGNGPAPLSQEQYFAEHGQSIGFPAPLEARRKPFEFNLSSAQTKLQSGELMSELIVRLNALDRTYAGGRPNLLYYPVNPSDLTVVVKPYSSVLTKIYRLNYLQNRRFPKAPNNDFVTAENLYEHPQMNDLLRARLVGFGLPGLTKAFVGSQITMLSARLKTGGPW